MNSQIRPRTLAVIAFAITSGLALSSVAWVYFGMLLVDKPLPLLTAVLAGLSDWYFWALLIAPVFWLGMRFKVERATWPRAVCVHLVAGTAVAMLELLILTTFRHFFYHNPWNPPAPTFADAYLREVLRSFHFALIIYCLIVAAAHAFSYYRDKSELSTSLARSQLDCLRAQLQPHFLFNSLNAISGAIREERSEEAVDLIASLGHLLRSAMATGSRDLVPMREELAMLDAYLALERARYRDRLQVDVHVDPAALDCVVPSLLLQPLVENAVRHGASETQGRIRISVTGRVEDERLVIAVEDNGSGPSENSVIGVGFGHTVERMRRLYGEAGLARLSARSQGGARVDVHVPLAHATAS